MPTQEELLEMYPMCDDDADLRATCPCKNAGYPLTGRCRPCVVWHRDVAPSNPLPSCMRDLQCVTWKLRPPCHAAGENVE